VDLYLFDFDKTLYAYNFLHRLPALARATGASQYDLASTWWAGGYETRAENGEWPTAAEYLDAFAEVTQRRLTLEQWQDARASAMTRIDGSVAALRRAATLGTVSLLSNNPSIFAASLTRLAPEVAEILGPNTLISCELGVRKPNALAYERALERYGATPENTFFVDDNAANIAGARAYGITGHLFSTPEALEQAITEFAGRAA
jgi:glucose-1-phosphatase